MLVIKIPAIKVTISLDRPVWDYVEHFRQENGISRSSAIRMMIVNAKKIL